MALRDGLATIFKRRFIMTILAYETLSKAERRSARKLAKELLRTVPAAENGFTAGSPRGAMHTVYIRPENLVAAFVYDDDCGNWWADIVFRYGGNTLQIGTADGKPARSRDEAFQHLEALIAGIKATQEHPLAQKCRELGLAPERIVLIQVGHEKFGYRWLPLDTQQIPDDADVFADSLQRPQQSFDDKLNLARQIVLEMAPLFASDGPFLKCINDQDEHSFRLITIAAAFLSANGVMDVNSPNYNKKAILKASRDGGGRETAAA
jgi:hypothetical protein